MYGNKLNDHFSLEDKIDFISCMFEVAYSDGEYHYLEEHMIKKIFYILLKQKALLMHTKCFFVNQKKL